MLEQYFVRPGTIDRIRASWIGKEIEQYVSWLAERRYAPRNIWRRVPILVRFAEFARRRGARRVGELQKHVERFVDSRIRGRGRGRRNGQVKAARELRGPIEQMLRLAIPGQMDRRSRRNPDPLARAAPGFFASLRQERGLREATLKQYRHHLRQFEGYLGRIDLLRVRELTPVVLGAFLAEASSRLGKNSVRNLCGVLRVFLRYLHRERKLGKDLSVVVESPRTYRLSNIPRAITWDEVRRMLTTVDRRSATGRRDYAILLLMVTYGLRAHEVAALTLDDIEWKRERLRIPERKAGHSTAYPLSSVVGNALVEYLRRGRPETDDRHVFFRVLAPHVPLTHSAVSCRATHYLQRAGITVSRAGSHTLRHTCAQRLVEEDFSLKEIGDYLGHRSPDSTRIYTKVAVEALRQVALTGGEEIL